MPKRKQNRLTEYDYSTPNAYFITVCTKNRKNLFWKDVGAIIDRPENVPLTNLGMVVRQSINDISSHYPAITVDHAVIMPNHIHLLLQINTDVNGRSMIAPTISTVVRLMKGAVSKQAGFTVWQSSVTPQIAVLPDGSLLVPADMDGTYRIDLTSKHISSFNQIYSLQSPYYAMLIGDNIMTLREGSTETTVIPLYGGQEYTIQLECDAPYENSICSVGDQLLFYDNSVGVCHINVDGTFSILIAQENIKIRDYQSLDYNNIWSIAANQSGVIAFYDNTLKCIRCISTE